MKNSSLTSKLLAAALTLGVLAYFGVQIYRYVDDPFSTTLVYSYLTHPASFSLTNDGASWKLQDDGQVIGAGIFGTLSSTPVEEELSPEENPEENPDSSGENISEEN